MKKLTAGDPETMSPDLVAANLERLKALFPELVTEGPEGAAVNVDVLKALVGDKTVTGADEKYGLNWHGKRQARQLALTPSTGTLRPCEEESVDWVNSQNIIIEGDNLETLKLLQKSYAGSVRLIYIDPPYNTGKDFVYPDDYKDGLGNYLSLTGQVDGEGQRLTTNTETSGRFHTDWLSMMLPRLKLARDLLRNDGVLIASIDDNESANLKTLLSEVFGEENYIDTLAVEMSTTSGPKTVNAQQGQIVKNVEFIHIFRKSADFDGEPHQPLFDGIDDYDTHYTAWMNEDGTLGKLVDQMIANPLVRSELNRYGLLSGNTFNIRNIDKLIALSETAQRFIIDNLSRIARVDRPPVSAQGVTTEPGRWVAFNADHRTYYLTTLANGTLQALMPLELNYRMSDDYNPRLGRTVIRGDLWKGFHQDMGNVTREGEIAFSNGKKPVRLIKQLVKWANVKDGEIVLDFFAGSGTTGHSLLSLNSEDGINRRYILIQLPEPLDPGNSEQRPAADFCDSIGKPRHIAEITKERMRRVGNNLSISNQLHSLDLGFRAFKLDSSNIRTWEPDPNNLDQTIIDYTNHIKDGRTEQDILYELLLKLGLDLCVPTEQKDIAGKTVHSIGGGVLMACLAPEITREDVEPLAQGVLAWHQALAPAGDTTCVFRDGAFSDDVAKTNLAAILNQHGLTTVRSL